MTITRVLLLRHCEPDPSVRGRCHGRLDVPLSSAGTRHAHALADALADLPCRAVYSSPLRRALDTARPIAARHGLTPRIAESLAELDFGELEGRTYDEIAAAEPDLYRTWMDRPTTVRFPGGENYDELRRRVLAEIARIRAAHHSELLVLVVHAGVVRSALAAALELPDDALFRIDQRHGGMTVIDWLDDTPVVRVVNASLHGLP